MTALRMAEEACWSIICDEDVFARSASCALFTAWSKSSLDTCARRGGRGEREGDFSMPKAPRAGKNTNAVEASGRRTMPSLTSTPAVRSGIDDVSSSNIPLPMLTRNARGRFVE